MRALWVNLNKCTLDRKYTPYLRALKKAIGGRALGEATPNMERPFRNTQLLGVTACSAAPGIYWQASAVALLAGGFLLGIVHARGGRFSRGRRRIGTGGKPGSDRESPGHA